MKLKKMVLCNFGSYKTFEYDFTDRGLSLIYGPTGSGKSTILDGPMWCLFGDTAKDGPADAIKSWDSETPTSGVLELETNNGTITIHRTRGTTKQNDLYYTDIGDEHIRGKDITETQNLIEKRIGISLYDYTLGSYYNEFSPAGSFFTAKASDRRAMLDSLADLSFPIFLTSRITESKKTSKSLISKIQESLDQNIGRLDQAKKSLKISENQSTEWVLNKERRVDEAKQQTKNFEINKSQKLEKLKNNHKIWASQNEERINTMKLKKSELEAKSLEFKDICPTCGMKNEEHSLIMEALNRLNVAIIGLESTANPHSIGIEVLEASVCPTIDYTMIANERDPHEKSVESYAKQVSNIEIQVNSDALSIKNLTKELNDFIQLQGFVDILRGKLIENSIKSVESNTNNYLEKYFDSELRVSFTAEGADKLNVSVQKSGHETVFKQLSKGQRCLLKLTFALSCMKAASNKSGVHFDTLMLDEALEGLDEDLKLKSFGLFSELSESHGTVLVIDHSVPLQGLFDSKVRVSIDNNISSIEAE